MDLLIKLCNEKNLFSTKNVYLLIVGDGPAILESKKYVKEHQISNNVIFTGSIPHNDVPDYIYAFNLALQPRVTDYACPMKIIEYLAMGKIIIAPNQANIRDILTDKHNALLFEPGDTMSLFLKIMDALNNKILAKKLSENAKLSIKRKNLTWTDNARKTIELLQLN